MNGCRNILLTLKYDGTNYHGFQVQKNAVSVMEVLQDAVEEVFGERLEVKGCSRTDAGVHALDYKLSFFLKAGVPVEHIPRALNQALPEDIAVVKAEEVSGEFHPRYHAISKEYTYRIHNSKLREPFGASQRLFYPRDLDVELLNSEAQAFVGTHDFTAFSSVNAKPGNKVRTIHSISVQRQGEEVIFTVKGSGFLRNMVRIIVGTLINIGEGRIEKNAIHSIIKSKSRLNAGETAPAKGLYLSRVFYLEGWVNEDE